MHSFYFMEYLFKCKYLLKSTVLGIIIHFSIRINIIKSYDASIDNLGNNWLFLLVFWHIKEYFTIQPYTNTKEIVNNNSNYYYYHYYYYHYDNNKNDENNNSDNV